LKHFEFLISKGADFVAKENPLQQGLKQSIIYTAKASKSGRKGKSTTTRIET